jgi:hypothetical protein
VEYVDIEINVFLCSEKLVGIGEVWREPDHDQPASGSNFCIAGSVDERIGDLSLLENGSS